MLVTKPLLTIWYQSLLDKMFSRPMKMLKHIINLKSLSCLKTSLTIPFFYLWRTGIGIMQKDFLTRSEQGSDILTF